MPIFMQKMIFYFAAAAAAMTISFEMSEKLTRRIRERLARELSLIVRSADLVGLKIEPFYASILAPAGPLVRLIFKIVRKKRLDAIDWQLPAALGLLKNGLKAGLALQQTMEIAAIDLGGPLGEEFGRVHEAIKGGKTLEDGLSALSERLPTNDVRLFVQSIETLRRTGGNLIETIDTLEKTLRERERVTEKIRTITANGRYQGVTLLAMPWMLALSIFAVAPDYIAPLFNTRIGRFLIAICFLMEVLGAIWTAKIVNIKV